MKTKQRILLTSRELFNLEGEQSVTTVDIANAMDISPGNLYYHFRGKESIISALYQEFEGNLKSLLEAGNVRSLQLKNYWFFVYVILEEIYQNRFFYLNLSSILQRIPELEKKFQRLVLLQQNTALRLTKPLARRGLLKANSFELEQLAQSISMSLVYYLPYQRLIDQKTELEIQLHKGVLHILSLLGPHLGEQQQDFYLLCQGFYDTLINES